MIQNFSVPPPELYRGKKCGCWLLVSRTKCGCCSSQMKKLPTPSDKTSSTTGSSATMFLVDMICTQTPAHCHLKIPIKWYGSIHCVSLVEEKCSSICPEEATENSIQMVNAPGLPFVKFHFFRKFSCETNRKIIRFHLQPKRNFRNLLVNGKRPMFSIGPKRSRSIPAWAHFPPRTTRQNAEGSWWSGCLKCRKLLHVGKFNTHSEFNSSLIFMRETYELFSRGSVQTRTDPQEIRNDQSTIFQEIRT